MPQDLFSHLSTRAASRLGVALLCAAACGPARIQPRAALGPPPGGASRKVGSGYVLTRPPPGFVLPGNARGEPVEPKVTADFAQVPTSNDWWSSLIWQHDPNNPYSAPLYAHPLTLQAEARGLAIGYPTHPQIGSREYMYLHASDFVVGLEGLASPDARVASYSDWVVTAAWTGAGGELRASFGHGFPFVYLTRRGSARAWLSPPRIEGSHDQPRFELWHDGDEWVGFDAGGHHYAVYGPRGAGWLREGSALVSDLAGKDFFSVAVLPDTQPATVELFRTHAYAFVTDTHVAWKYDQSSATLRSTFTATTELKQSGHGNVNVPLLALYRHQWRNTRAELTEKSYVSPRGAMKLLAASSFVTELRFSGILPILPNVARDNADDLEFYVKESDWQVELFPPGIDEARQRDAYWDGKSAQKLANVAQIADQIGYGSARDHLLRALENELEDWFDGRAPRGFYYDERWRTLLGFPENFNSSRELNDHHFHYGYLVYAAAIVARYDPTWAQRFGDCVRLLIRDVADWDRSDRAFPFLRYMDPYAGHSWANGPALFREGNNQEASSEDVNFSSAVILWGALSGDDTVRDLGIFLYSQQLEAIDDYWWDRERRVFPAGFGHGVVGTVWGAGARYDTFWDPNPIFVQGINLLPVGLYMGRYPESMRSNYAEIVGQNRGDVLTWRDVHWMALALAEPQRALALFRANPYYAPEFGNSRAMTYHWISNLAELGQLDTQVVADTPTYAVFQRPGRRTHVAFNASNRPQTVRFSDGATLRVGPRQLASATSIPSSATDEGR